MTKKICFFVRNYSYTSGVERVTSVISNHLASLGHDVTILSLWGGMTPAYDKHPNIKLYQIFEGRVSREGKTPLFVKQAMRFPLAAIGARKFLREHPQDILIDTDYWLGLVASPALLGRQPVYVHWEHIYFNVDPPGSFKRFARKMTARIAQGIVTLTERDKESWIKGATVKGNIKAIHNPIPFDVPNVQYNLESKVVLAVGRLDDQKGYDLLLQAWSYIESSVKGEGWKLHIVGDGDNYNDLMELRSKLNIEDSTEMIPATSDVDSHYRSAAIYCLSSRFEGFPMVLLEAQAYKLPTVAFDCDTGPAEIVINNETGYLVENGNVKAFADALLKLISSKEDRSIFSSNSADAAQRFYIAPIAEQWIEYLDNITTQKA